MAPDRSSIGREDALVCADVLGGFGVASDHVRELVDADGDLEAAIQAALAAADHPTEFVRGAIAASPRGVDAPAAFWTTAPETQLGDVFASLDWTFDVRSANGRSLAVDDEQPYRLRVEDADGRTRSTGFSFPDTPFGDDNYPALVHAVNDDLLFGLDCKLVQLSDGSDRWRFALVETDELDRLRDQFGDDVTVFGEALLAPAQPDAYVPDDTPGQAGTLDVTIPDWADPTADDDSSTGWRDRELTAASFDADHVGGLDHLSTPGDDQDTAGDDSTNGRSASESSASSPSASSPESAGASTDDPSGTRASPIEFVEDDPSDGESGNSGRPAAGELGSSVSRSVSDSASALDGSLDPVDRVEIRDADVEADRAKEGDDDLDGWSIGGTVDATTRSTEGTSTTDTGGLGGTSETTESQAAGSADGFVVHDSPARERPSTTTAPTATAPGTTTSSSSSQSTGSAETRADRDEDLGRGEHADLADEVDEEDAEDEGFFSADAVASFDAGAKTQTVAEDSFGVDAEAQTADDQFAAVGAAISAPARISVGGLLDDDEFLPEIPRAEPAQVRIEFEDEFDPSAPAETEERETEDGFVWVNESGGLREQRSSATD